MDDDGDFSAEELKVSEDDVDEADFEDPSDNLDCLEELKNFQRLILLK